MRFVRSFLLMVSSLVLAISLLLLPPLLTLRMTLMNRAVVTSWLTDDSIAQALANKLSDAISSDQAKSHGANIDSSGSAGKLIDTAARAALTPNIIEQNSTSVIDGTYDWLEGKTDSLSFKIDLTAVIKQLGDKLVSDATNSLSNLPACPAGTTASLLKSSCLPTGLDLLTAQQELRKEILDSTNGVSTSSLSADQILIDQSGQSVPLAKAIASLPTWYQRLALAPIALVILIVISCLIILFSNSLHAESSWTITTIFGFWGVIYLIIAALGYWLGGTIGVSLLGAKLSDQTLAQAILPPLLKHVSTATSSWTMAVAGAYLVVALVTALIRRAARKRRHSGHFLTAGPQPARPATQHQPQPRPQPQPSEPVRTAPPDDQAPISHTPPPAQHRPTPSPVQRVQQASNASSTDEPLGVILSKVSVKDVPATPDKPADAPLYEIKPKDQQ